jgi:GWxTD domain-containing protein
MRRTRLGLTVLVAIALPVPGLARAPDRPAGPHLDARRATLRRLQETAREHPGDARALRELAAACLDAGFTHAARVTFERVTGLDPSDAGAWRGQGLAWKRDWLATLADASLQRAVECLSNAARLEPENAGVWTHLAALRVEQGDAAGAARSAAFALAADPSLGAAYLAAAAAAHRAGRLAEAESLFAVALPRLPDPVAQRFRDLAPLLDDGAREDFAALPAAARAEAVRRFWVDLDPDPTSAANEAWLEYQARVAHAVLLVSDAWEPRWDMRAELYVRYGAPARVSYQPPGVPLARRPNQYDQWFVDFIGGFARDPRHVGDSEPMWYPLHAQVWDYPDLGMRVLLEDRAVSQNYELPRNSQRESEPSPDPEALARSGFVAAPGGRGAFAPLPPGTEPLPVRGLVSVFQGADGPRLVAHVVAPGVPGAELVAECVVLDSSRRERQRASRPLGPSRCDPAAERAGDFAFDLPPGSYRVAVAVSDGRSVRGVFRAAPDVAPPPRSLAMSELVPVCGPLEPAAGADGVRLDPAHGASVGPGAPLLAYFEVYQLRPDASGATLFEYEYTVRSLDPDRRPWHRRLFSRHGPDPITVRTPERGRGPTRRQYLSVPVQSLPAGRYRLEVRVRDERSGAATRRALEFTKRPPQDRRFDGQAPSENAPRRRAAFSGRS